MEASSLAMPSQSNVTEGNVQGFLDQARRQEQALQPRQPEPEENEDIFDNNDNEETPY